MLMSDLLSVLVERVFSLRQTKNYWTAEEVFIRSLSRYAQAAARVSLFLPILVPEETLWIMPQKRHQRWGCE